jgi:uncharacterized protein with PhoU and TrkA domain
VAALNHSAGLYYMLAARAQQHAVSVESGCREGATAKQQLRSAAAELPELVWQHYEVSSVNGELDASHAYLASCSVLSRVQ